MKILGIDYGRKKSGIAISDGKIVEPLEVVKTAKLFHWLALKAEEEKIEKVVLGLPENTLLKKEIKKLGEKIKKELFLNVVFVSEELTTLDAKKILGKIGRKRRYKKEKEDAIAAAIMLESYFQIERS